MQENRDGQPDNERPVSPISRINMLVIFVIIIGLVAYLVATAFNSDTSEIDRTFLDKMIEGKQFDGTPIANADGIEVGNNIERIQIKGETANGVFKVIPDAPPKYDSKGEIKTPPEGKPKAKLKKKFRVSVANRNSQAGADLYERLADAGTQVEYVDEASFLSTYIMLMIFMSVGILIFMFIMMRRAQNQMLGGGGFLSNFSRSPAKKYEASDRPITFKDVAGLEGVKADLLEIVEFLKDPTKFQKLGGRVPKGVLLVGPPGTGKTLLAKAVAGEADVPFFSVNGSEFIQMFVGVGASRVRDLFANAKAQAPAIIFVDEIDAVGRQRGAGLGGGHDEREQTLNQILGEMDGFQENDSVIIVAATNRPDILDPALLRPGRFDRHVTVARPTLKGRLAIFKVHVRNVPLAKNVDLKTMASATVGMTGADIQNLVNEAALWAARKNKSKVEMNDFYYAHDKVLMGARREEILTEKEKERTAYHEAGHTLAAWFLKGAHPVHKVTIIPRGQALGVTQMVPMEDRMNMSEPELVDQLVVLLSGRAAEKLIYDEYTVGAENDLERGSSLARRMVTHWGMSQRLGPVSFKMTDEDPFLGREIHKNRQFSEHTMEVIDEEVTKILQDAAHRAINLLKERRDDLEKVSQALLAEEELDRKEIAKLIGPSVHDEPEATEGKSMKSEPEPEPEPDYVADIDP